MADNYGDPTSCLAEIQFFGVGKKSSQTGAHKMKQRMVMQEYLSA